MLGFRKSRSKPTGASSVQGDVLAIAPVVSAAETGHPVDPQAAKHDQTGSRDPPRLERQVLNHPGSGSWFPAERKAPSYGVIASTACRREAGGVIRP